MSEQEIIGKGTWIDKLAFELLEREKKLGRNTDLLRVESGLGASGIPQLKAKPFETWSISPSIVTNPLEFMEKKYSSIVPVRKRLPQDFFGIREVQI